MVTERSERPRGRDGMRRAILAIAMVVFVTAVWIVTSGVTFDRTQTPAVPGGAGETGPRVTGPAETGRVQTGPTVTSPDGWDGYGIPPEGTAPSTPVEGHPILVQQYEGEELLGEKIVRCPTGCSRWYHTYLVVYADGRVLWWNSLRSPGGGDYVLERRLTPEGVDLVRSGVEPGVQGGDLPDTAWADAEARPYAPPRYSVCFWQKDGVPVASAVDSLPAAAKAVLDGSAPDPLHPGCLVVNTRDARAFSDILSAEGLGAPPLHGGGVTPGVTVDSWLLPGAGRIYGEQVGIYLHPLWPDGYWHKLCCA